jgi:hypothetical protein
MSNLASDDRVSAAGRGLHDLSAAALFGGNLFARVGMHPALASISAPRERGVVVNRAWRRYGAVNTLSLAAVLGGWTLARREEASDRMLSESERKLAKLRDASVVAVAASGLASALTGVAFGRMEPKGAVALLDGDEAVSDAPMREARTKRLLNALGSVQLVASGALVTANAALTQAGFRRAPRRRLLRRSY